MDLLQIITGLLCVGAIICLAYQLKELHHAFKNTDNFKDFLSNNDYDNQKLKVELDILEDKHLLLQKENRQLEEENKSLKVKLEGFKNAHDYIINQNRKLKEKLPSHEWLYLD
jgi:hypothetical protein